ncbi:hypothetical protein AALI21_10085 [Corynebacteriaceae bacterium 6-324]
MFKKFASIAVAGALAVGIAAPAPAMANPAVDSFVQSAQNSSQGFWKTPQEKPRTEFFCQRSSRTCFPQWAHP